MQGFSVNDLESLDEATRGSWLARTAFCSLERQDCARHRRVARDRPRDRRGARARRRRRSSSATAPARRRPRSSPSRSAAARCRRTSRPPRMRGGWSTRRATSTCSSTTRGSRATALLARMSDEDWHTVIETNLSSVFYTCRAVTPADDEEASRLDRQHQLRSSACTATGARRTTPPRRRGSSASRSRSRASSAPAACARTSLRPAT